MCMNSNFKRVENFVHYIYYKFVINLASFYYVVEIIGPG